MNALAEALASVEDVQACLDLAEQALDAARAARDTVARELVEGGFSSREAGALLGVSHVHVLKVSRPDWGPARTDSASQRLAVAREAYAAALHAQKLREERYAMGYRQETRTFYGETDTPVCDEQESRVRWAGWHQAIPVEL